MNEAAEQQTEDGTGKNPNKAIENSNNYEEGNEIISSRLF